MSNGWLWIDLGLILLAVMAGISGYRHGAVASALALAGMLLGTVAGILVAPHIINHLADRRTRLLVVIVILLILVLIGETAGMVLGRAARRSLRLVALRRIDSVLGAALHVVAILAVAWLIAIPIQNSGVTGLANAAKDSKVLSQVDRLGPSWLRKVPDDLNGLLRNSGLLPDAIGPFGRTPVTAVSAPDPALESSAIVSQVHKSVVKIVSEAPSCGQELEGSGFVVSPGRVMTNAHVVAGTGTSQVQTTSGTFDATVVFFDPSNDIAVLDVPDLAAPPLKFKLGNVVSGDDAIALGYPEAGPYTARAARIRSEIKLESGNIYQQGSQLREVYTIRAVIRQGNSGGPLIDPSGQVLGVVFGAAENQDSETGFALTSMQVQDDLHASSGQHDAVDTHSCVRD